MLIYFQSHILFCLSTHFSHRLYIGNLTDHLLGYIYKFV